jgi:predicted transcriptional regulator
VPANVRIKAETYTRLKELAVKHKQSLPEVLDEAVDQLYRRRFLEACNRDYARLRKNSKAWKEELARRKQWDATNADGLEAE